ncbi:MAG: outer membrane lipoprotein-sorting protein [Treponema sp.]|nr:outer membrane lipoprotein-sorting protein [Treponema sp.]MCL2238058.1 outer membrane lipoprotein-sorting protein [Treponema sp.]
MKKNKLTVFLMLGAVCLLAPVGLFAQNADAIMTSAKNRVTSNTISSRSRMVITARDGSTTERLIDQYSKDGPNGARTVIVFQRPANVAGTRFLTMDNASGGSDQWIFLPSLGRVRRIASSESGGNFMGTDFSYDDISSMDRDVSLDTHTVLREETFNGRVCYVIQSVPKNSNYQYSRTVTWIDKENYQIYKAEMYNRRNEVSKIMEMSDFRNVQGRTTPMQTRISTVAAGTSTTIFMEILRYDEPIPEGVFTTAYLETGRP